MESLESLRSKFMDSKPAPMPEEAFEPAKHRRRSQSLRESHAIPKWGWWVIGLALAVVAAAATFVYFGEEAILKSLPDVLLWLGYAVVGVAALVVYFLPAIIAMNYRVKRSAAILSLNFLLGWTFIFWAGAFVWAVAEVESQ